MRPYGVKGRDKCRFCHEEGKYPREVNRRRNRIADKMRKARERHRPIEEE